jgi:hypothetical protein
VLGRIRRRRARDHHTPSAGLAHAADGELDEVENSPVVDIDNAVTGLKQLSIVGESVSEVVGFFGDTGVGDRDVDAGACDAEGGEEGRPGGDVAGGEVDVVGQRGAGCGEVEDVDGAGTRGEELRGGEADAGCAA